MSGKPAICSWSGGKDSCLAFYEAKRSGYDITSLLTFITREDKRGAFHGIESAILDAQAQSLGIAIAKKEVGADMQRYEEEFKDAVRPLKASGARSMIFGDVYLLEPSSWVDRVCGELGIEPVEPLWNREPASIVDEFVDLGFKAVVVSCKAGLFGRDFIGRTLDRSFIKDAKKAGSCPCGENGEFHTLVVDGPIFKKKIEIGRCEALLRNGFWEHWFLDIKRWSLVDKSPVAPAFRPGSY